MRRQHRTNSCVKRGKPDAQRLRCRRADHAVTDMCKFGAPNLNYAPPRAGKPGIEPRDAKVVHSQNPRISRASVGERACPAQQASIQVLACSRIAKAET